MNLSLLTTARHHPIATEFAHTCIGNCVANLLNQPDLIADVSMLSWDLSFDFHS